MKKQIVILVLALLVSFTGYTAESFLPFDTASNPVKVELILENDTIQPGRPFWVAVKLSIEKGWHAYWKNPGDAGMAIEIEWKLPKGYIAGETQWPYPQRFESNSLIGYGYESDVWLMTQITPPSSITAGSTVNLNADINWLVCSDSTCLPGSGEATTKLNVISLKEKLPKKPTHGFGKAWLKIPRKQWRVQAQKQNGLIELHLYANSDQGMPFTDADFFPESQDMIDHKIQAILTKRTDQPGHYTIVLREPNTDTKSDHLKGIIVMRAGPLTEALDLHVAIKNNLDDTIVASADRPAAKPAEKTEYAEHDVVLDTFDGGLGWA